MTGEPVRAGVIGLGRSGWFLHAQRLAQDPQYQLVAVVDPEAERRREAEKELGCRAYATAQELIADGEIEMIAIATPSHTHGELTCAALDAGKHVLVEKPMAVSVAEAQAMIDAAQRNGKLLTVFHLLRYAGDFLKVREIIESGVLGPLHQIRIATHDFQRRADWQTLRKFGGGQLNNTGAHYIDQVLALSGGQWHRVFCALRHTVTAGDADDHVKLVFTGKDDVIVDVEITLASCYSLPKWAVMGKYGSLTGTSNHLEWRYYDPASMPEPVAAEGPAVERRYGSGEELPWRVEAVDVDPGDSGQLFYDQWYGSIREAAPLPVPPEEIRNLIALFDECRAQNGM